MAAEGRFRIDARHIAACIDTGDEDYKWFTLERRYTETEHTWGGWRDVSRWERLGSFQTREAARAHYELIKDLPEYLP